MKQCGLEDYFRQPHVNIYRLKLMIEIHMLPFHSWIRTSRLLAKCVNKEGKTEMSHAKQMHSYVKVNDKSSSAGHSFQPMDSTESECESFVFPLYFNSVYFSQIEVRSPCDESNWLTNQQCTIYRVSPTLQCERISDAERKIDLIETVQQSQHELIQW